MSMRRFFKRRRSDEELRREMEQHLARCGLGSFVRLPIDLYPLIQAPEHGLDVGNAADDRLLAGDHRGSCVGLWGDQGRGQVSGTDILIEGAFDLLRKVAGNRYRRHEGCLGRETLED